MCNRSNGKNYLWLYPCALDSGAHESSPQNSYVYTHHMYLLATTTLMVNVPIVCTEHIPHFNSVKVKNNVINVHKASRTHPPNRANASLSFRFSSRSLFSFENLLLRMELHTYFFLFILFFSTDCHSIHLTLADYVRTQSHTHTQPSERPKEWTSGKKSNINNVCVKHIQWVCFRVHVQTIGGLCRCGCVFCWIFKSAHN